MGEEVKLRKLFKAIVETAWNGLGIDYCEGTLLPETKDVECDIEEVLSRKN